jgi:hypothetical protein
MPSRDASDPILSGKTNFDDIYDRPDPGDYYRTLGPLDYQIPHHAQRIFRTLLAARRADGHAPNVVDLCCSYGINAALLRHDLTLADLYTYYRAPDRDPAADVAFFDAHRLPDAPHVTGLDVAAHAVGYAVRTRLLDAGYAENLEGGPPTPALHAAFADACLITVTGGVGYITEKTFHQIVAGMPAPPWIGALVLRAIDYQPIADTLATHGLVTELLESRTFPQRRFADETESRSTVDALTRAGVSTSGKESTGFYHANLFVSRPAADVRRRPLEQLLG